MKGINDTLAHADELMAYLEGLDVKVNLIPYNAQSVDRFQTPEPEVIDAFAAHLRENSFRVLLRRTKGHSIMAACGQLGNPSLKIKKII
jgi:23S rRNA (adenine2503-C2)-methyltransferase